MEILQAVLPFILEHLPEILASIAALVGGWIYKDKANKDDAVASIKTGVIDFFQTNPEIKEALADGKITKEEWEIIFERTGPVAASVATKGGSKVLKRWTGPVAKKYIEAVAREIAAEFRDNPAK